MTFVRLSPTLQTLSTTPIQDATFMSASSLPSGWVFAAWGEPELFLHALDASGKDLGRTKVDTVPANSLSVSVSAVFAPRTDGGPLLVWQVGATMKAAIVAADGRSLTTPRQLPFDGLGRLVDTTAAYVGGAFYVVAPVADSANPPLRMVRVASASTDTATFFQKIAATGASASDPVMLTTLSNLDEAAGAFAFATETVAVLSNLGAGRLDGVRIGGNGQIATPLFPVMSVPGGLAGHVSEQNVARVGSDIVALWYTESGIRLARVTP